MDATHFDVVQYLSEDNQTLEHAVVDKQIPFRAQIRLSKASHGLAEHPKGRKISTQTYQNVHERIIGMIKKQRRFVPIANYYIENVLVWSQNNSDSFASPTVLHFTFCFPQSRIMAIGRTSRSVIGSLPEVTLGMNRISSCMSGASCNRSMNPRVEVGYVFGRNIEYESDDFEFQPSDAVMVRAALSF